VSEEVGTTAGPYSLRFALDLPQEC